MDKNKFIKNLKAAVKNSGLKNHEIAAKMGINESQVSRWVVGNATPSALYLGALCKAIGVATSAIYDETPEPEKNININEHQKNIEAVEIEQKYLALLEKNLEAAHCKIRELEAELEVKKRKKSNGKQ